MSQSETLGVLLMAYGTPDTLENVEPYYTHIRGGRQPAAELVEGLRERYRLVGGATPLLEITRATRQELEKQLNSPGDRLFRVYLGMKHWHPFIEQAMGEMDADGIHRAVGLVLAPHYSRMSVAGYYKQFDAAQVKLGTAIELHPIDSWHVHQPYLDAVSLRVRQALASFDASRDVSVIFTAHSLPARILEDNDPYPGQLEETCRTLAVMLNLSRWSFSYQSAGQTGEPWLGPDLVETVQRLADEGVRDMLVASVGFVSDHLEILYDIDIEAQQAARQRGVNLKRTEMLNSSPDFVAGLAELVRGRASDL